MAVIDVGTEAIDRAYSYGTANSRAIIINPANDTGTIDTIEIWAATNMSGLEVATFYIVSGTNLSTRDSEAIGNVTAGSKQTFTGLTMDVVTGDMLGEYFSGGSIERGVGADTNDIYYRAGDNIPCTDATFTKDGSATLLSLYGTGATAGAAGGSAVSAIVFNMNKRRRS